MKTPRAQWAQWAQRSQRVGSTARRQWAARTRRLAAGAGRVWLAGWLAGWAALAAAQATETSQVPVTLQRSHAICPVPGRQAGAWLIDDAARWATLLAAREEPLLGRAVAWGREQVLVVALAEQPTLGIRITVDEQAERAMFRRLHLAARIERPRAGEMSATALSRPCVIAVLPSDPWKRATVQVEGQRVVARSVAAGPPRVVAMPDPSRELPGASSVMPVERAASK